ncbi:MAG: hypothetical protein QOE61_1582, partial [Micromonosporaceae bacterium]|nr:hypothetical protein [Micromonosporaceae bacterium]
MRKRRLVLAVATGTAVALGGSVAIAQAWPGLDAGQSREGDLEAHSVQDFGVVSGLVASSTKDVDAATATADPLSLVTFAKGLTAKVITSGNAAPNLDMAALWPPKNPQYIISCNEECTTATGVQ